MKALRLLALLVPLSFFGLVSARAEANWLTDFQKAQQEAKTSHKLLLINFTGSDWCPWCVRLHREVFAKDQFADFARDNLVLMEVDFPRSKPLDNQVRQQNMQLAQRYSVDGFPTVVVLNSEGKMVGLLGYVPGGPDVFIQEIKKIPRS